MPSANAYVFLGPEIGKKREAIEEVKKRLSKNGAPEETVFYAGEPPALKIAEAAQNHGLFAQSRLFVVKNADQIKKKDEVALVASCMEGLDGNDAMILVSDEFKLAAGVDGACPAANRKVFYEMFENQKADWVRSFFRNAGREVTADGVDMILEMVENNTDALRRECSRLALFLPRDRAIEGADAEKWLSRNREESAFTLFSRIAFGDAPKAIESLRSLLAAKESPQAILAGLAWCFRKLRDYLALVKSGKADNSFETKKIGLSSPKAKKRLRRRRPPLRLRRGGRVPGAGRRVRRADAGLGLRAGVDPDGRLRAEDAGQGQGDDVKGSRVFPPEREAEGVPRERDPRKRASALGATTSFFRAGPKQNAVFRHI